MSDPILAANAEQAMDNIVRRFEQLTFEEPFVECAQELRQGMAENFAAQTDAQGNAWPPRKIQGDGHPLLVDKGSLLLAASSQGAADHIEELGEDELLIGTRQEIEGIPKAAALNFGFEKRNLPARQFIYGRGDRVDNCADILADFALEVFE